MTTRPDYTQIAVGTPIEDYVISIVGGIPTWSPASGGGGGDVDGPSSSTDNAIVRWDGDTGRLIQDSNVIIDDSDNVYGALSITANEYVGVGAAVPTAGQLRLSYTGSGSGLWTTLSGGTDIRYIGLNNDGEIGVGDNLGTISVKTSASGNIYFDIGGTDQCEIGSGYLSVQSGNQLRLRNAANNQYIAFRAPALISSMVYILPMSDGSSGQMLSTNGSGTLSWATPPTGLTPPSVGENGYVAIANGGNLTYYGGVTNGYVLTWNTVSNTWVAAPGGVGDVVGPASAEDNVIVRFNLATGKLIKSGTNAPTYDNTGNLNLRAGNYIRFYNSTGTNYVGLHASAGTGTHNLNLPTYAGSYGNSLCTDGSGNLYWGSSGSGDVVGPASSTNNAIVRWDLTTGKLIKNSGVIISNANSVSGAASVYAGFFAISSGAATTGGLRLPHSAGVYSKNYDGSGNLSLINTIGVGDYIRVGDDKSVTTNIHASASVSTVLGGVTRTTVSSKEINVTLNAMSLPIPVAVSGRCTFFMYNYGGSVLGIIGNNFRNTLGYTYISTM